LYQDASDAAAGLKTGISRAFDPSTGDDVRVPFSGFQFQLTYEGTCVNILDVRPLDFPGISGNINNSSGTATFRDLETVGVPPPVDFGHALTRLVGGASEQCLASAFGRIVRARCGQVSKPDESASTPMAATGNATSATIMATAIVQPGETCRCARQRLNRPVGPGASLLDVD
jgi:hypothetical protein